MSTGAPDRTCGSCNAPVAASDETCPRCGALLAAYEAPRGSEAGTTGPSVTTASVPIAPVPARRETARPDRQREPVPASPPEAPSGPKPGPASASTEAGNHPKPASTSLASERKKAQPVPHRAEPGRRTGPDPAPPPTRERPPRRRVTPARQPSTRETSSTTASIAKLALGVLMVLVVLGIFDFDLIPILILGVVMLSLLGIMRAAARASGRKTTSMHDPRRRDTRRW